MPPCLFSQEAEMATKEENLNRLRQLAGLLGREADMSGSAADIAQRVSEWETKVRRKLVKERSRLKRATVRNPNARIIVNRGDLPVIKLGIRMLGRRPNSILKAGQHRYQRAFIQRLKNGRWHVMQRVAGKNRYPIDVVKIPMAAPLKQAFDENVDRIRRERLPKELAYALKQQLRIAIKR
ncbi:phage tail protein [Escherichia coli]|nr:phage tail protein [Escherichia coli]